MRKIGLISVKHQDVKEAGPLQACLLRAPPETCVLQATASCSWVILLMLGTRRGMHGRKRKRWPVSISGDHSCPKSGNKIGVLPVRCPYCSRGMSLGPWGTTPKLPSWGDSVERNLFWQGGYVMSVGSLGTSTVSVSWAGVGGWWLHFASASYTKYTIE